MGGDGGWRFRLDGRRGGGGDGEAGEEGEDEGRDVEVLHW